MVERLAEALDIPPTERNVCLLAAGYAPVYPMDGASAGAFEALERILDFVMARQTSFPALVIDEGWNIRMRNRIDVDIFAGFREAYRLPPDIADNAMHVLCHPDGLRRFMPDWARYVVPFVREIEMAAAKPGSTLVGLRDEILDYPGVAEALAKGTARTGMLAPVLTRRLIRDNVSLAFRTAFTTFPLPFADNPTAVKIESFFPPMPRPRGWWMASAEIRPEGLARPRFNTASYRRGNYGEPAGLRQSSVILSGRARGRNRDVLFTDSIPQAMDPGINDPPGCDHAGYAPGTMGGMVDYGVPRGPDARALRGRGLSGAIPDHPRAEPGIGQPGEPGRERVPAADRRGGDEGPAWRLALVLSPHHRRHLTLQEDDEQVRRSHGYRATLLTAR